MRRAPFNPRLAGPLVAALGALYAWPLIAFGLAGSLTRYMADDFCVVALARSTDLFQSVVGPVLNLVRPLQLSAPVGPGRLAWSGPHAHPASRAHPAMAAALAWSLTQLPFVSPNGLRSAMVLATVIVAATLSANRTWSNPSIGKTAH